MPRHVVRCALSVLKRKCIHAALQKTAKARPRETVDQSARQVPTGRCVAEQYGGGPPDVDVARAAQPKKSLPAFSVFVRYRTQSEYARAQTVPLPLSTVAA